MAGSCMSSLNASEETLLTNKTSSTTCRDNMRDRRGATIVMTNTANMMTGLIVASHHQITQRETQEMTIDVSLNTASGMIMIVTGNQIVNRYAAIKS